MSARRGIDREVEYCVRFRRYGNLYAQVRFFQSRQGADRLVRRLTSAGRTDLAPLQFVHIESRLAGRWLLVEDVHVEDVPW